MKMRVSVPVLMAVTLAAAGATAQPLATAFTYQGRLTDGGNPASGAFDFQFVLMDAASGGAPVGPTLTRDDVTVTNGLFTVSLDFGAVFGGARRWVQVSTRPGASTGAYTTLAPLQELTAAPHAAFSLSTPWSGVSGKPAGFADDVDDDSGGDITGVTAGSGLTGGGATGAVSLAVDLSGSGSATTVARSDHNHFAQSWNGNSTNTGLSVINQGGNGLMGWTIGGSGFSNGTGVLGASDSTVSGTSGVRGSSSSTVGQTWGVHGLAGSANGAGVFGEAATTATTTVGVMGRSSSSLGAAASFSNFGGGPTLVTNGRAGIGTQFPSPLVMLDVAGVVRSSSGGFRFPDDSVQATAAINPSADITSVAAGSGLSGGGSSGDLSLSANFGGSGSATTVSRTDHDHFAQSWTATVSGPGFNVVNTTATQNGADNVSGLRGSGVYGVLGESASTVGRGVYGRNNSISGVNSGVMGQSSSTVGRGVYGLAAGFSGVNYGVYGETNSTAGYAGFFQGRVGINSGTAPQGELQIGQPSEFAAFRFGNANARHHLISNRDMVFNAHDADGVLMGSPLFYWRRTNTLFEEAGAQTLMTLGETGNLMVTGNAAISGLLSKGGGSFKIDHPLDPENRYLYHSFVESPDMKNVYDGVVTTDADGYATVELPDWFEALNRDFRYQLTVIDDGDAWVFAKVAREMKENRFVLRTSAPRTKVSWQVTGIRHDAFAEKNRIPVEEDKAPRDRGRYLHPAEHGQPVARRIE